MPDEDLGICITSHSCACGHKWESSQLFIWHNGVIGGQPLYPSRERVRAYYTAARSHGACFRCTLPQVIKGDLHPIFRPAAPAAPPRPAEPVDANLLEMLK